MGGDTLQVAFDVACESFDIPAIPGSVVGVYERSTPSSGTISYDERYVFLEDGTFRLQFHSPTNGFFQYPGIYSTRGLANEFLLDFDDDGRWQATAILHDDCLIVEYNLYMFLSDFEDGEYCRS